MSCMTPKAVEHPGYGELADAVVAYIKRFGVSKRSARPTKASNGAKDFGHTGELLSICHDRQRMINELKRLSAEIPDFDRVKAIETSVAHIRKCGVDQIILKDSVAKYLAQAINLAIKAHFDDMPPILAETARNTVLDRKTASGTDPFIMRFD